MNTYKTIGITKDSGYFTIDAGDKAVESNVIGLAAGICLDFGCNYVVHDYLWRHYSLFFQMGIDGHAKVKWQSICLSGWIVSAGLQWKKCGQLSRSG